MNTRQCLTPSDRQFNKFVVEIIAKLVQALEPLSRSSHHFGIVTATEVQSDEGKQLATYKTQI